MYTAHLCPYTSHMHTPVLNHTAPSPTSPHVRWYNCFVLHCHLDPLPHLTDTTTPLLVIFLVARQWSTNTHTHYTVSIVVLSAWVLIVCSPLTHTTKHSSYLVQVTYSPAVRNCYCQSPRGRTRPPHVSRYPRVCVCVCVHACVRACTTSVTAVCSWPFSVTTYHYMCVHLNLMVRLNGSLIVPHAIDYYYIAQCSITLGSFTDTWTPHECGLLCKVWVSVWGLRAGTCSSIGSV